MHFLEIFKYTFFAFFPLRAHLSMLDLLFSLSIKKSFLQLFILFSIIVHSFLETALHDTACVLSSIDYLGFGEGLYVFVIVLQLRCKLPYMLILFFSTSYFFLSLTTWFLSFLFLAFYFQVALTFDFSNLQWKPSFT